MAKSDNTVPATTKPMPLSDMKTMSSKEVAELTGKQHTNVLRDVRKMLQELDDSNLSHKEYQELTDSRGYTQEFLLNEELTLTLVSGYNVKMRNAIIRRWKELEAGKQPNMQSIPLASCTPIMFHGVAILMLHRPKKDWVCFRSLCDVMGIDYKHHLRVVKDAGFHFAQIEQTGEKVFCISYQSAVSWLQNMNPEKIRLNKRHKVVTAMLQLPKLLTEARDAYRKASPSLPKTKLEHTSKAQLLAALEKIEGKKLVVMPCEVVLAFDSKVNEARRKYWKGMSDLGLDLMNSGFTLRSLRQEFMPLELKP